MFPLSISEQHNSSGRINCWTSGILEADVLQMLVRIFKHMNMLSPKIVPSLNQDVTLGYVLFKLKQILEY